MTKAASELIQVIKQYLVAMLPDNGLQSKINQLYAIFQEATVKITCAKPIPLQEESPDILEKYIPPKALRVIEEKTNTKGKISTSKPKLSSKIPISKPKLPPNIHRYPIRLTIAKAAQTVQIEEAEMISTNPVTL